MGLPRLQGGVFLLLSLQSLINVMAYQLVRCARGIFSGDCFYLMSFVQKSVIAGLL